MKLAINSKTNVLEIVFDKTELSLITHGRLCAIADIGQDPDFLAIQDERYTNLLLKHKKYAEEYYTES